MKDLNEIIKDDKAFEDLFSQTMQKVGHEYDKERINVISKLSEEDFRSVIGTRHTIIVPIWKRTIKYIASSYHIDHIHQMIAVCIACILIMGGGIGGIQYNAYYQTYRIGNMYLPQISSDISNIKGDTSTEMSAHLTTLFSNVAEGKDLNETINKLQRVYTLSLNEESEYHYVHNAIAWNLAMAYLKTGKRDLAKPVLSSIINNPDNEGKAIQDYAQKALNDINSIFALW